MDDSPVEAVRKKKEATIMVGFDLVKNGEADAVDTADEGPVVGECRRAALLCDLRGPVAIDVHHPGQLDAVEARRPERRQPLEEGKPVLPVVARVGEDGPASRGVNHRDGVGDQR